MKSLRRPGKTIGIDAEGERMPAEIPRRMKAAVLYAWKDLRHNRGMEIFEKRRENVIRVALLP
jgi:hypothetical protein